MCGQFLVDEGCKEMKKYGSFPSRAVYIEPTNSLSADAFIQSLQMFFSKRGNVQVIRNNNDIIFTGASAELNKAFLEMNHIKINELMLVHGGHWI